MNTTLWYQWRFQKNKLTELKQFLDILLKQELTLLLLLLSEQDGEPDL